MPPPRLPYAVATVLAGVALLLGAGLLTTVVAVGTCLGDGGSPYSADLSPAGRFCRGPVAVPYFLAQVAAPVLLVTLLGVAATVRRSWRWFWAGVGSGIATLLLMSLVVVHLPSECTDEQLRRHPQRCGTY